MPKDVRCKNCNNLVNHWCEKIIDSPDEDRPRDCSHFWERTNGDRIRSMNDQELADFICSLAFGRETPWCDPFTRKFCDNCPTIEGKIEGSDKVYEFHECDFADGKCPHGSDIVWWLQQPAEEA